MPIAISRTESATCLPPGQVARDDFPRFGAPPFDGRFPTQTERVEVQIGGDVRHSLALAGELQRYRPLINPTAARFEEALQRHQARVPPPEPSQTTSSS